MPIQHSELSQLDRQAMDWLIRLRSEQLHENDLDRFAAWLASDEAHAQAFARAERLFREMQQAAHGMQPRLETPGQVQKQRRVNETCIFSRCPSSTRLLGRWLGIAAAIAAVWLFATQLIAPRQSRLLDNLFSDYATSTGEIRRIVLEDGSVLLLDTETAVSIDDMATVRRVRLLHGRTRFDVADDAGRPFEVQADDLVVRALGTVFEVYKTDSGAIKTTVQKHAVAVRLDPGGAPRSEAAGLIVSEGQTLYYRPGEPISLPATADVYEITAWQQRRLSINDQPLADLILELERYRKGRIFIIDQSLKNLRVSGVFSLENPDSALNSVCKALRLSQTAIGPWWVILSRNQN